MRKKIYHWQDSESIPPRSFPGCHQWKWKRYFKVDLWRVQGAPNLYDSRQQCLGRLMRAEAVALVLKSSRARSQTSLWAFQYLPATCTWFELLICFNVTLSSSSNLSWSTRLSYILQFSKQYIQRQSSCGMGLFCRAERAFRMLRHAISTRVWMVALPMWGSTTHLTSRVQQVWEFVVKKYVPRFLD